MVDVVVFLVINSLFSICLSVCARMRVCLHLWVCVGTLGGQKGVIPCGAGIISVAEPWELNSDPQ